MTEKPSLEAALRDAYDREVNVSVASFYDAGWTVRIGDELNRYTAAREFGRDELGQVADWIVENSARGFTSEQDRASAKDQLGWHSYVQKWPPRIAIEDWLSAAHPDLPALPLRSDDGAEAHSLMVEPLSDGEIMVCLYDAHGREISTAWSEAQYAALQATARSLDLRSRVLTFLPAAQRARPTGAVLEFAPTSPKKSRP